MDILSKEALQAMLPKVGDRLIRRPTMNNSLSFSVAPPLPCVVVYVNAERLWYLVQFERGYRQAYKVPGGGADV